MPVNPSKKTRRTGPLFVLVLFVCLVLFSLGFVFSRATLPWRILRPMAVEESRWSFSAKSLGLEPFGWSDKGISLSGVSAVAFIDWIDMIVGGSFRHLSFSGARLATGATPEFFGEFDFSAWREPLGPHRFPVEQVTLPGLTLSLDSGGRVLSGELSGIRNPAGALETSGSIGDEDLAMEFFVRLGWDSLESGGTFAGTIRRGEGLPEFVFPSEPFQSLLGFFKAIHVEGSFFLDEKWRFRDGVRMVNAAEESARLGNTTIRELAFSAATVFARSRPREDRAVLEGLLPGGETFFRIEANRRGNGPVHVSFLQNGNLVLRIDAERWQANSPARMKPSTAEEAISGRLREASPGEWIFDPDPGTTVLIPAFRIPGFFAVGR